LQNNFISHVTTGPGDTSNCCPKSKLTVQSIDLS